MWDCSIGLVILSTFLKIINIILLHSYKGKELKMLCGIQNEVFQEMHSDVKVLVWRGKLPLGFLVFSLSFQLL